MDNQLQPDSSQTEGQLQQTPTLTDSVESSTRRGSLSIRADSRVISVYPGIGALARSKQFAQVYFEVVRFQAKFELPEIFVIDYEDREARYEFLQNIAEVFDAKMSNKRRLQAADFLQAMNKREQQLYEKERDAEEDRFRANNSYIAELEERHSQEIEKLRKEKEEEKEKAKMEGEDLVSKILAENEKDRRLVEEEKLKWQERAVRYNQQLQFAKNNLPSTTPPLNSLPNPPL